MRTPIVIRRRPFILVIALASLFAFVFAACGAASTGTGSSATPTAVQGYGAVYGCPSDAVVSNSAAPNVLVSLANKDSTVMAHSGNLVEVDLPFGQRWSGPTSSQGELQLQNPYGYALKDKGVCAWQFVAQGSGTTHLTYSGRAICEPGKLCPQYITQIEFTIDIK